MEGLMGTSSINGWFSMHMYVGNSHHNKHISSDGMRPTFPDCHSAYADTFQGLSGSTPLSLYLIRRIYLSLGKPLIFQWNHSNHSETTIYPYLCKSSELQWYIPIPMQIYHSQTMPKRQNMDWFTSHEIIHFSRMFLNQPFWGTSMTMETPM